MHVRHADEDAEQEADLYVQWLAYQQRCKLLALPALSYLEWKLEENFDV